MARKSIGETRKDMAKEIELIIDAESSRDEYRDLAEALKDDKPRAAQKMEDARKMADELLTQRKTRVLRKILDKAANMNGEQLSSFFSEIAHHWPEKAEK